MRKILSALLLTLLVLSVALALSSPVRPASAYNDKTVSVATAGQTLVTTVQDPAHPLEPWVVTSYKGEDESMAAFIRRHGDMVAAVREMLRQ